MGETEPYVMDRKDGRLKMGVVLDESYINSLRREKDRKKHINITEEQTLKYWTNLQPDTGEILENDNSKKSIT